MFINIVSKPWNIPNDSANAVFLVKDNWNDFGFYTTFNLVVFEKNGDKHEIGLLRMAYKSQQDGDYNHTSHKLGKGFEVLSDDYFSLGASLDYYRNVSNLPEELVENLLNSLKDLVYNQNIVDDLLEEDVLKNSLLRDTSLTTIKNQYLRVLKGEAPLTEFFFQFKRTGLKGFSDIKLEFKVYPESKPNTNVHVLIGRNGIGKTTILNGMIDAVIGSQSPNYRFVTKEFYTGEVDIPKSYFSRMVSVSFSAFDPFKPYKEQNDPTKGTRYNYIGLKSDNRKEGLKNIDDLYGEFIKALKACDPCRQSRTVKLGRF